jgi:hypothetical protein
MYNAPEMVDLLKTSASKVIGPDKVNESNQIMPGGDVTGFLL